MFYANLPKELRKFLQTPNCFDDKLSTNALSEEMRKFFLYFDVYSNFCAKFRRNCFQNYRLQISQKMPTGFSMESLKRLAALKWSQGRSAAEGRGAGLPTERPRGMHLFCKAHVWALRDKNELVARSHHCCICIVNYIWLSTSSSNKMNVHRSQLVRLCCNLHMFEHLT